MNEIKDLNKWRVIPCSWIGRLNIFKISVLPKLILHIQCNPSQNSTKCTIECVACNSYRISILQLLNMFYKHQLVVIFKSIFIHVCVCTCVCVCGFWSSLSITEWVVKSPTVIVDLPISVIFCFIHFEGTLGAYTFRITFWWHWSFYQCEMSFYTLY